MKINPAIRGSWALLAFGLLACGASPPPDAEPAPASPDPHARVQAMSDLLAAAPALHLTTQELHRWPADNGEWSELEATYDIELWRPDALHIIADGTGAKEIDHTLIYDGWMLTVESHAAKVFARSAVPPTVDEMLDEVAWRFELPIPAADMLYSSPIDALIADDTEGRFVAQETIEGRACDHFAFVGPTVDWEIWVEADEDPLPCRIDIVHKEMGGPPRSQVVFTSIDLEPAMEEDRFVFEPQEGYREVPAVENRPPDETDETDETPTENAVPPGGES